jgi:hypothetical protein
VPVAARYAVGGAVVLGGPGAVVGLVLGLHTYAPTAWAAVVEVGLPAALLGTVLGLVVGALAGLPGRGRDPLDR